ncbi:MAG TPA: hypothetical protein VFW15_14950 [Thermoanaerobaculia bacterium]|nr:hypothetical protein [Thermoanaerobaculia bacterium]
MSDPQRPTLRAVAPMEPIPARRRSPGVAVIAVAAYALLFLGALWYFEHQTSRIQRPQSRPTAKAPSRDSLLTGIGLSPVARKAYFGRISTERCDCGCDLTVLTCLARDRSCVRSPALASERRRTVAAPATAR